MADGLGKPSALLPQMPAGMGYGINPLGYQSPTAKPLDWSPGDSPESLAQWMAVLGTHGLKQSGGWVLEEFLRRLHGRFGAQIYREMADNSSVIGAIRYTIRALIRQTPFRVEPCDESPEAAKWQEFVEDCLEDMSISFEDFVSEAMSMLDYGWAFFETVYKLRRGQTDDGATRSRHDDGLIGWRKFAIRSQDTLLRWEIDPYDGGVRGMWQVDPYAIGLSGRSSMVYVPIEKALLFRTETTKANPEGRSIYRNAVVDYHFMKRIQEIEATGIERDMTGLLTMEVPIELLTSPAGSEPAKIRTALETMLSQLKRDEREFAMVPTEKDRAGQPTGFVLKLLSTGGRRQIDTTAVKTYYRTSILQTVLAQFLQLGVSQKETGSFALASSSTNLFAVALGTILDMFVSVLNRFAIPRLMRLNGVDQALWPKIVHGDIETPPLAEIGSYIQQLATAGAVDTTSQPLQRKLLEIASLPEPPEGEPAEPKPAPVEKPPAEPAQ